MKAAGAAAEVQVAAHSQAHPAAADIRAEARSTAGVGNLQSIYGPTDPDAFRVGTLRKRPM
jgi:hypothetical protein